MMYLLDTRFACMAKAVGTSRILGRVHLADLKIIDEHCKKIMLQCLFTVLVDNKVDFLFLIENLRSTSAALT